MTKTAYGKVFDSSEGRTVRPVVVTAFSVEPVVDVEAVIADVERSAGVGEDDVADVGVVVRQALERQTHAVVARDDIAWADDVEFGVSDVNATASAATTQISRELRCAYLTKARSALRNTEGRAFRPERISTRFLVG